MKLITVRGALLLPLFFICFPVFACDDLSKYFDVFYLDVDKYDKWIVSDKNDYFKDVFVSLYNLPDRKKRKFNNKLNLEIFSSYTKQESYGYVYLEIPSKTVAEVLIYGIKKGEVSINGEVKGKISVLSETGYVSLKGVFEKGIYFVSLKINERNQNVPIVILSDTNLKSSKENGFSKKASHKLQIQNYSQKEAKSSFNELFTNFCFPYLQNDSESRKMFFLLSERKISDEVQSSSLIYHLSNSGNTSNSLEKLKNAGFSQESIVWWQKNFFEKEVCGNEQIK